MNPSLTSSIPRGQKLAFLLRLGSSILFLNFLVIVMAGISLKKSRLLYEDRAAVSTQNLAKVLEDNIDGVMDKIDLCLRTIKHEAERHLVAGGFNKQEFNPFIHGIHSFIPELESLRIADAQGEVILGVGVVKRVNITDRDYFRKLRSDPKAGLVIARPVVSRMAGKWVLNIARRINYPDGSFAGVVFAQLTLDKLSRLFSIIDIGKNGTVTLRDSELGLIIRYPKAKSSGSAVGQKLISQEFAKMLASNREAGTYFTPISTIDNLPRTFSYRKITHYPLYIQVGQATSDYLDDWKSDSFSSLVLVSVFIVTTLISAWALYRRWQKQMLLTEELRRSKDELETRVVARTAELETRNRVLDEEIIVRKRAEEKLNTVAHYTRSLIEASLDPLVTIGPDGKITDVNAATETATGYSRNELIETDFSNYFTNPEHAQAGYQMVFQDGQVRDYPLELKHRDGHVISVLYNASIYRGENGYTIGVFAAARDVTKRKQAEDELHEKTVQLEQEIVERQCAQETLALKHFQLEEINRTLEDRVQNAVAELRTKDKMMIQQSRQAAMGEMISNIAHQWKQPLNNLGLIIQYIEYGFAARVLSREDMTVEVGKCLDLITFMSQTIEDFRSFFSEDKQKTNFGVRQSIARTIRLVSASLIDRNIKIFVEQGDEIQINGYPNEYAQVLLNLLGNARDVLLERQITDPVITVGVAHEDGRAVVTVSDNGEGISASIIGSIFDPYFTTKKQEKGTGIGLFMSKMIIEEHMGGSLTVINIEGGAQFRIEVPTGISAKESA